jgi:hypothetical protein
MFHDTEQIGVKVSQDRVRGGLDMHAWRVGLVVGLLLTIILSGGCVRQIWEAPGLRPGSRYTVGADMRVETFELAEREIRAFRMEVSRTNRRRYQFVVYSRTRHEIDYTLDLSSDDVWELIERRPDGISAARRTWAEEPSYLEVKAEVIRLLGGR